MDETWPKCLSDLLGKINIRPGEYDRYKVY